ncbi:spore coat protein y [Bacillus sp. OxB-1]|uniref:CotY/CotZ family spore coat protein n=1 Tax=Bacillus sp. (strain OxB-1) TaxID=98228 RepID=UPI0005820ED7|nr:CotY/CotZ family spore coat protein [Bacillus sp. OxB-1]BAQ10297.1 spore coat protein y [Bacillus sp. OxB-1]
MGCGKTEDVGGVRGHDNCICEVVRAIKRVQDLRDDRDCDDCASDCFTSPLGSIVSPARQRANTRVFTLSNNKGDLFKALFKREHRKHWRTGGQSEGHTGAETAGHHYHNNCISVFFRVQNIFDNCCATLQVLEPLDRNRMPVDITKHGKIDLEEICRVENFAPTGSCITVDLKCFCGIQCVKDIFIDCDDF